MSCSVKMLYAKDALGRSAEDLHCCVASDPLIWYLFAMNFFGKDLVVSLVDDAFIFSTQTQDTPLVLPAYVAIQTGTARILACGEEARAMLGREPTNISVVRVLVEGTIADQEAAEALFRFGLPKLMGGYFLVRLRVIIASRTFGPGKLPVQRMGTAGGAREVYLIEMGMATAIGMKLDVEKPEVKAVLTVSDDWFEFAVISLAGILTGTNGALGTRSFVEDIQNHLTLSRHFRPDPVTLTSQLESAGLNPQAAPELPGWETWAGRTEAGRLSTQSISRDEMTAGMMPSLVRLTERIKEAIRRLPDDKQYQLSRTTIQATGSALRIPGLAQMLTDQLGYPVTPFPAAIHPSVEGAKTVLKELNSLRKVPPTGR
jgi:rod shape-determining protein MreB